MAVGERPHRPVVRHAPDAPRRLRVDGDRRAGHPLILAAPPVLDAAQRPFLPSVIDYRRAERRSHACPLKEAPLATFHGDETFPIEWASETERDLFWVFDDLHCPHPLSPMFEDIGGWWLTCDHMFRRFGTPFASDWIAKNINGYLYTAAIPAEAGVKVATQEYGYEIDARRAAGPGATPARIGAVPRRRPPRLRRRVRRLVARPPGPREMDRNFAYLEEDARPPATS